MHLPVEKYRNLRSTGDSLRSDGALEVIGGRAGSQHRLIFVVTQSVNDFRLP
jgi:hypothetical protein